jgi:hypothetical protein
MHSRPPVPCMRAGTANMSLQRHQQDARRLVNQLRGAASRPAGLQKRALVELVDLVDGWAWTTESAAWLNLARQANGIVAAGAIPAIIPLLGSASPPALQFLAARFLFYLTCIMFAVGESVDTGAVATAIPPLMQLVASGSRTRMPAVRAGGRQFKEPDSVQGMAESALLVLSCSSITSATNSAAAVWSCNMGRGRKTRYLIVISIFVICSPILLAARLIFRQLVRVSGG